MNATTSEERMDGKRYTVNEGGIHDACGVSYGLGDNHATQMLTRHLNTLHESAEQLRRERDEARAELAQAELRQSERLDAYAKTQGVLDAAKYLREHNASAGWTAFARACDQLWPPRPKWVTVDLNEGITVARVGAPASTNHDFDSRYPWTQEGRARANERRDELNAKEAK